MKRQSPDYNIKKIISILKAENRTSVSIEELEDLIRKEAEIITRQTIEHYISAMKARGFIKPKLYSNCKIFEIIKKDDVE